MSKEILLVAEAVSNEKGVPRGIIFEAIEQALATATKKRYDEEAEIRVTIDRTSGDYETYRRWAVVGDDQVALLGTEFTLQEAHEKDTQLKAGDVYEERVENIGFGRIAARQIEKWIADAIACKLDCDFRLPLRVAIRRIAQSRFLILFDIKRSQFEPGRNPRRRNQS